MAVVRANLRWSGQTGSIGDKGVRNYNDVYDIDIELEEGIDPRTIIRDALGTVVGEVELPARGLPNPRDPSMFCRGIDLAPNGGPISWVLTARYSSSQAVNQSPDPTLQPPVWRWGSQASTEELDTDRDNKPVATTAGEPFETGIIVPQADTVLEVQFNVAASVVTPAWLLSFRNKTNADAWNGGAPGEVFIDDSVQCQYVYATDDVEAHWQVAIRFLWRKNSSQSGAPARNAWMTRRLNQGYRYLDDENKLVLATDKDGMALNRPILLDAAGKPTSTPHWLWFRSYDETPFAPLSLVLP